ncbi:MAG: sulfite exporter TauE/SafE family protein [Bauldia sp.]|nr:sulfite exporter TauE/SafE family protein [Bauldia sp.]
MLIVDFSTFLLAAGITLVAAVVQASVGIGFGMIAVPLLFLLSPQFVPGTVIVLGALVTGVTAWRDGANINRPAAVTALAGRLPGALAAGWLVSAMPVDLFAGLFGLLILAAAGLNLAGFTVRPTRGVVFVAGAVSGVMGTITSVGAPPLALVFQGFGGAGMRATISVTLLVGAVFSIGVLLIFGAFSWRDVPTALLLAPVVLVGFVASRPLAQWLDRRFWRLAVYLISIVASVLGAIQALNASQGRCRG